MNQKITMEYSSSEFQKIEEYAKSHNCSVEEAIKKACQIFLAKGGCTPVAVAG